jgi:hypothetical protein
MAQELQKFVKLDLVPENDEVNYSPIDKNNNSLAYLYCSRNFLTPSGLESTVHSSQYFQSFLNSLKFQYARNKIDKKSILVLLFQHAE